MNAERLLKHYERIADAPDAIARLRRFILDLAVRGKLVPQDPKDEPAAELLKRIAAEKARLVKAGEIKRTELVADLNSPSPDLVVPPGWAITNLQSVCASVSDGDHLPPPKAESGIPFLVIGNVRSQRIDFAGSRFVPLEYYKALDPIRRPRSGDLLCTLVGSYGIPVVVRDDQPFCVQRHVGILRPSKLIDVGFLARAMESRLVFDQATACATGIAQKTVPLSGLRRLLIPLPPLAEQHRIVAKVDELMALCDRLESAGTAREVKRDRLTVASLARLNAPDPDAFRDDALFALDALPAITARPDQIKQLRQTILNLAVRGKLVPQDPNDEPASELLKRIRQWQFRAISQKQIRAPRKPLKPIRHDESPYPQPDGWAWVRLGEIIYIQSGHGLTTANMMNGTIPVFGGNGINGYHDQHNVDQQTIVIGRVGYHCGSVHVTPPKAWITDNAFITYFSHSDIYLRFLALLLNGTNLKEDENATAQPVISGSKIYPIVVGLAPLAEQHRIVAKFDELMALCDDFEASLRRADSIRRRLLAALLAEALVPDDERELEAAE
jgi:type I restriction enzyme S subunit